MGKRKLVIFDFDETLLLTKPSHGSPKDTFKNPHRLLPLMLFMNNSALHKIGILTNRSHSNEKEGLSSLDANKQLENMGIGLNESYVIRRPADYGNWADNTYLQALDAAKKLPPQERAEAEAAANKKFGGKNHRLEQMRNRAAIEEGVETPIEDTIMVDDGPGVIENAQKSGYGTVKATEFNYKDSKSDDNSNYLIELGQKIGLNGYVDDLVAHPENHRNDPPMQMAGALMYGIQTRDNFNPKFSDYLKKMTYSEKQQIKAMVQYIQANRPDYENDKDFKAFVKALPSDSTAKKNETKRDQENLQFLDKAELNFNKLLHSYENASASVKVQIQIAINALREGVRALTKDNNPIMRNQAKAVGEKIFEHAAVTQSHLKQLANMSTTLQSGQALTDEQVLLIENTFKFSASPVVRAQAKEVRLQHHQQRNKAENDQTITKLFAEYSDFANGKMDNDQKAKFIDKLELLSVKPSLQTAIAAIKNLITTLSLGPHQLAFLTLLKDLSTTVGQAKPGDQGKFLFNHFLSNTDFSKIDSIQKQLAILEQNINALPQGRSIVGAQMLQAIAEFNKRINLAVAPLQPEPVTGKSGTRPLPVAPAMVVDALNKQTTITWELRQVTDGGLQRSQVFSAKMTKSEAEKLLTSLHKDLHAKIIESVSDKHENRFRVALDTKEGAALLQRHAPLTAPPVHRPLPVIPQATSQATRSSSTTAKSDGPPPLKKDDSKRRSGPST